MRLTRARSPVRSRAKTLFFSLTFFPYFFVHVYHVTRSFFPIPFILPLPFPFNHTILKLSHLMKCTQELPAGLGWSYYDLRLYVKCIKPINVTVVVNEVTQPISKNQNSIKCCTYCPLSQQKPLWTITTTTTLHTANV